MSPKEKYIKQCEQKTDIPLFSRPEWFDLFSQDWDVVAWKEEGVPYFFPYVIERKFGFHILRNMPLTPYLSVIVEEKKEGGNHISLSELLNHFPNVDECYIDFHPNCDFDDLSENPHLTEKHTNCITLNIPDLFSTYKSSLQRQIRKAEKNLHMVETHRVEVFHKLYCLSLHQRNVKDMVESDIMNSIWSYVMEKQCGRITLAKDKNGNLHAALFCVWDSSVMYYLAGGTDKHFYGSGAMGMLLHEAISKAKEKGLVTFDFEGSMEKSIDRFFKTFQTSEKKYFSYQKLNSPILKLARKIKGL